jgi:hypothetical protein
MANLLETKRLQDWINLVLAACLFVSPWVLGFAGEQVAAWTAWASAVVIGVLAVAAIVMFTEWEEWMNLALGMWVVLAPWVLGFTGLAYALWAHVALGLLVAAVAAWELWLVRHEPRLAG